MTLTAVVADLDLSVGAVAGLSVTVAALVMVRWALTGGTAIAACLLAGLLVGCVNAALIVWLNVPPLLATLGTLFTVQGLKRWMVDGQTLISGLTLPSGERLTGRFTDDFTAIDGSQLLGIPLSVYLFVVIAVLVWVFLERTRYGRVFYAVGGNAEAARLAGVRVRRFQFAAYAISGVLAAVGRRHPGLAAAPGRRDRGRLRAAGRGGDDPGRLRRARREEAERPGHRGRGGLHRGDAATG